jgi:hypothetical protein
MLATLKEVEEKLASVCTQIKSYFDARFRAHFEECVANVYGVAVVNPDEEEE